MEKLPSYKIETGNFIQLKQLYFISLMKFVKNMDDKKYIVAEKPYRGSLNNCIALMWHSQHTSGIHHSIQVKEACQRLHKIETFPDDNSDEDDHNGNDFHQFSNNNEHDSNDNQHDNSDYDEDDSDFREDDYCDYDYYEDYYSDDHYYGYDYNHDNSNEDDHLHDDNNQDDYSDDNNHEDYDSDDGSDVEEITRTLPFKVIGVAKG
ncbi:hypothetical protein AWC38_SpisGene23061 [Stylophora pistillata]|uniref:Uncharacterized protein n=1 Tax=Stylophora pistillata TaxID=50429 RepID=A0A2B4R945_STYPI|nr:hypothetical protein AWC38_SpisGene23061 [Stylophora pistillata]